MSCGGFLAGRTTIRRSLKWCRKHLEELKRYLILKNGIASPSTACRILAGIDEELSALEFMEWIGEIVKYLEEMSEDHKKIKEDKNHRPRYPEMQENMKRSAVRRETVTDRSTAGTVYAQNAVS